MPESAPLTFQSVKPRAPEPLEEAVEKCVSDTMKFALAAYCNLDAVNVTRSDVGTDLECPAVVVRAARVRESIPNGDVYEIKVELTLMVLMDQDDEISQAEPSEFMDQLWSATVAIVEDPNMLDILRASRTTVTWHGLLRNNGMEFSRSERHAIRSFSFSVHVSRLLGG